MRILVVSAGEFTFFDSSEKSKKSRKKMDSVVDFLENEVAADRTGTLLVYIPSFDGTRSASQLKSRLKIQNSEVITRLSRNYLDNLLNRCLCWRLFGNAYPDVLAIADSRQVNEFLFQYKYVPDSPVLTGDIYLIEHDEQVKKIFSCP